MANEPLLSIVTIFLNPGHYLDEAIESVLFQTCPRWELLLVDDGSTDASSATARRYAERYPDRIRYLEHPGHQNRGMSASRNLGISAARGRYIAFLDADDVWLPDKLEQQVAIMEAHPEAAMVYGAPEYWYSWTGRREDRKLDRVPELGVSADTLYQPPQLLTLLYPLGTGTAPCPSDLLIRGDVFERVGGFEESFGGIYQMYEDQAFLAKVYWNAPVYVSSMTWTRYRRHPDSCVTVVTESGQYETVRRFFLTWLERYLAGRAPRRSDAWRALQRALWRYRHPRLFQLYRGASGREKDFAKRIARCSLPAAVYSHLRAEYFRRRWGLAPTPPIGEVKMGSLRRVTPISRSFGFDRGRPVDRYYIEAFLARHAADIRGRVLEIGDPSYTRAYGGDRVLQSDVLHVSAGNPQATMIGDLAQGDGIPSDAFACLILTQTLHLIYDVHAAVATLHRILEPGGVVLATVPGISQIAADQWGDTWFWAFTTQSARRLFEEFFPSTHVRVEAHGNVLAAVAFLHGLASEELARRELEHRDPLYQLLITVRARKPVAVS